MQMMDAPDKNLPNFQVKFGWFKSLNDKEKDEMFTNRKAASTNKVTKLWVNCFKEYLSKKDYLKIDEIPIDQLPAILTNFYLETCKKKANRWVWWRIQEFDNEVH